MDSKTVSAIKKYQRNCSIKYDGVLNNKTQDYLNKTMANLVTQYDRQYAKAVELLTK
jgi:murein L,D-transpeptidase YcbB/YkuD